MRLLQISRLTLAVAITATGHIAHGALLEGGAVAAPDEYSAKVAAQVLKAGGCRSGDRLHFGRHLP